MLDGTGLQTVPVIHHGLESFTWSRQILAQNKQRAKPVPEKVILELVEKLEPPTVTECHQLIVHGSHEAGAISLK